MTIILKPFPKKFPKYLKFEGCGVLAKKEIKLTQQPTYAKDYWLAKRPAAILCVNCGKMVCKGKMYRHIKTPICKKYTKTPEEIQKIKNELCCDRPTDFSQLD